MSNFVVVQYYDEGFENLGVFDTYLDAWRAIKELAILIDGKINIPDGKGRKINVTGGTKRFKPYDGFWVKSDYYLGIREVPRNTLHLDPIPIEWLRDPKNEIVDSDSD